jgi:uncharacterized protein YgiM (DUF1202 family)
MAITQTKLSTLWKFTGLAVLVLLLLTVVLAVKSRAYAEVEITGYIVSSGSSVYLRSRPGGDARIVTILERNATVNITDTATSEVQTWYRIEMEDQTGWVPAENISFAPP